MLTVGSLFTGCMGLDLGLEATGHFRTEWACEIDEACRRVIARQRPSLHVEPDVRTLDDWLDPVDVIAGGFPCQDLSYAGRGAGLEGDRSGLWHAMARAVRLLRPRLVLVENVPGLADRGFGRVLYDLAASGYVGRWLRLRAADVGAPHWRERIFVFAADAGRKRLDGPGRADARRAPAHEQRPNGRAELARPSTLAAVADAAVWGPYAAAVGRWQRIIGRAAPRPIDARGRVEPVFVEWMLGLPHDWTAGEKRTARLRMLGNAVQVQCGSLAGLMLLELAGEVSA